MAAPPGVQIEGMARFRRTVKKAGADMKDFTVVNRQVATIVANRARVTAPHGPEIRGHVARTVRGGANRTSAIVRVGNNTGFRYANPIHWGWFRRHIRPNPWVSRAATETESTWLPVFERGINAIVHKIRGK